VSLPDQSDIAYHMPFMEDAASKAAIIMERGVGRGAGSTRAFARGLKRSAAEVKMHIGVDIRPEGVEEVPDSYWYFVCGPSEAPSTAIKVAELIPEHDADIIFIDTIHIYEHMELELPIWERFAGYRTLWIFHDTWMFGIYNHMTEAIKDFCNLHPEWEFVDHSREAHGLGLMRWKT